MHDKLDEYLKSLTIPSEVYELYMAVLEDTFNSNEGDRKKQIQGLKERIRDQEDKIARCDEMLLNREFDKEAHQRMIPKLKEELPFCGRRLNCKKAVKRDS